MKEKFLKPKIIIPAVIFLLALILIILFIQYQKAKSELVKIKSESQVTPDAASETKKLIEEVGKLILLPIDETPTVATVNDVEKLRASQPFFQYAKNGDKVLVYSKKAILYDPVAKKIIDVSPLSQSTTSAQIAPSPSPQTTPSPASTSYKFAIYNGTKKAGLAKTYETGIFKKLLPSSTVIKRADAKGDYTKGLLIDLSDTKDKEAETLAKTLNLENAILPEKEIKPEGADFLIILGTDQENL